MTATEHSVSINLLPSSQLDRKSRPYVEAAMSDMTSKERKIQYHYSYYDVIKDDITGVII